MKHLKRYYIVLNHEKSSVSLVSEWEIENLVGKNMIIDGPFILEIAQSIISEIL